MGAASAAGQRSGPSASSGAPAAFFGAATDAFRSAAAGRLIERHYGIGGKHVLVRFAGPALAPSLTPAIDHLSCPPSPTPDLTVQVFDDESTETRMPPTPWAQESRGPRGVIEGYNDDRFFTVYPVGVDILHLFDAERNSAIYWTRHCRWIQYWEVSSPMRLILHWRFRHEPLQLIHAGAVGTSAGGVLIAGKSGSGKSTTALACLESDLLYAGDDYVLADVAAAPYVHSLYSTAKLVPDNRRRFPGLARLVANSDRLDHEKAVIFLGGHLPGKLIRGFPLRAILLPRVTGLRDTRLVKAASVDAYQAIVPTTLFQLARIPEAAARKINVLCRSLPVYVLEAGTDLAQIPRVIGNLLRS